MKMLTPYDVAEALQVSYDTVLSLIKKGDIPYIKIGRQYRVTEEAMKSFIAGTTVGAVKSRTKDIYNRCNANDKIKIRRFN